LGIKKQGQCGSKNTNGGLKMKFASKFLVMVVLFVASSSFAAGGKAFSVKELVDQYYQQKENRQTVSRYFSESQQAPPRYCPPSGPSCTDAACEKLGRYGCDDLSEIKEIGAACRGNYDGSCLTAACEKLGRYGCDDKSEVQKVARACVGNYDSSCFESVCNRLGRYGCDDTTEVEEVLRSCAGN
jgi:hypothetical protein